MIKFQTIVNEILDVVKPKKPKKAAPKQPEKKKPGRPKKAMQAPNDRMMRNYETK